MKIYILFEKIDESDSIIGIFIDKDKAEVEKSKRIEYLKGNISNHNYTYIIEQHEVI